MLAFRRIVFGLALIANSCTPHIPQAPLPIPVLPSDLVRHYRDSQQTATDAYTSQKVAVLLTDYTISGKEIHWRLSNLKIFQPVLVFTFANPPTATEPIWIEGFCTGRHDDGIQREQPGFTFSVRVIDCRIVSPPNGKKVQ